MARATAAQTPPVRHRPVIERAVDGAGMRTYRMACTCGAAGETHHARRLADWDLRQHVAALPRVPAAQRCQDPARHGRRFWEACGLCMGQEPLFDLAPGGAA